MSCVIMYCHLIQTTQMKTKKYKGGWFKFWIKSSRGTNSIEYQLLKGPLTKDDIKWYLEEWCSSFGAWHVSGNYVEYGFVRISPSKLPARIKRRLLNE